MSPDYVRHRSAWRVGVAEALGVPAAVLSAGFIGYGALAADAGYPLWLTSLSTVVIWALPGQLVLHEMHAVGAPALMTIIAVGLTAARFLPMTMTLLPIVRDERHPRWKLYLAAHFVSMTSWAVCMRRCAAMPREHRLAYLIAFSLTCWTCCLATAAVGYFIGGVLPPAVRLGSVFLTPAYFFVILVGDARTRLAISALACGAVGGPLFYAYDPQWSLVAAGLVGGTIAYVLQRGRGDA